MFKRLKKDKALQISLYWAAAYLVAFFVQGANAQGVFWIYLLFGFLTYQALKGKLKK
jgi:hypothetical protein